MPKVSVYLPDDLYRAARDRQLSISALTQRAIEQELGISATNRWIDRVRSRPQRSIGEFDTAKLLDDVRSEFGA
jgi:post-segregation antitoxin (ccd killing protein)